MKHDASLFLEVEYSQRRKHGQNICGDVFKSQKYNGGSRVIAALSDGLGSGVKANILAGMTATMALQFMVSDMDFRHSAEVIMDALPVCQVRKISYATFTIVDCAANGVVQIIEMDNPPFLFLRNGETQSIPRREMASPKWRDRILRFARTEIQPEDRIVFVSDGITQAGLGSPKYPLGWRHRNLSVFVREQIAATPHISARDLADAVVRKALAKETRQRAMDDMTCGVIYFRRPRKLIALTGPPFDKSRDGEYARMLADYDGTRVICGGTTCTIVSRELDRPVRLDLQTMSRDLPPLSVMEGVDLITEGILTLTRVAQILEEQTTATSDDPAARLAQLFMESDIIEFVVGSRINEAHQDPKLPMDLEIRRNIVKRVANALETRYLKETSITCI